MKIRKGDTERIVFFMSDETDNETGEPGILTPSGTISKNGGAFAAVTNTITEISGGWYYLDLTATETNTVGPLIIEVTGTGSNVWRDIYKVTEQTLTDAEVNRIIDMLLRRDLANVEGSSYGETLDVQSMLGVLLMSINSSVPGTETSTINLTVKKTDDTTLGTPTIGVDASGNYLSKSLP